MKVVQNLYWLQHTCVSSFMVIYLVGRNCAYGLWITLVKCSLCEQMWRD